jgi:hypothetical protein
VTAPPSAANFPLCGIGFARTDFVLSPPGAARFLRGIAKQSYLRAWMGRFDRFISAAIIFFRIPNGRFSSLLAFVTSADLAVFCDGQNPFAYKEQDCTRPAHLLIKQPRYFHKTKCSVWIRNCYALDHALMEGSVL